MLFKIIGKRSFLQHEYYSVTLRSYKDGQASPDVFSDFEIDVPRKCKQDDIWYLISERAFLNTMLYWRDEVEDFNNDRVSEQFGDRLEQANIDFYDLMCNAVWIS